DDGHARRHGAGRAIQRPALQCAGDGAGRRLRHRRVGRTRPTRLEWIVSISERFIRRPVMTVVLTVSAILFGVLAYWQLPVNDLPAVDYPVITFGAGYPGASPELVASNISTPLERQIM